MAAGGRVLSLGHRRIVMTEKQAAEILKLLKEMLAELENIRAVLERA